MAPGWGGGGGWVEEYERKFGIGIDPALISKVPEEKGALPPP